MNTLWKGLCALVTISAIFNIDVRGAILTGNVAPPPANINLTDEGSTDWIHFGLNNAADVNRKSTGGSKISNFTLIGSGDSVVRLTDSPSKSSWSDGSPTANVVNTPGGVYINNFTGAGRGFQFTVPADLTEHTLEVFLGEYDASGTLQASLNDGSGLVYSQILTGQAGHTVQGVYTINFAANTPGSLLTVRWTETADLGPADNITLQAAALCTPAGVPEPTTAVMVMVAGVMMLGRRRSVVGSASADRPESVR